jgi:cytochrome P450
MMLNRQRLIFGRTFCHSSDRRRARSALIVHMRILSTIWATICMARLTHSHSHSLSLTFPSLAGSDTTGISLRACFYYVLRNPRVLAKLRDEISTFSGSGQLSDPVTLEETLKMPYLYVVHHSNHGHLLTL